MNARVVCSFDITPQKNHVMSLEPLELLEPLEPLDADEPHRDRHLRPAPVHAKWPSTATPGPLGTSSSVEQAGPLAITTSR